MREEDKQLLYALGCALQNEPAKYTTAPSKQEWDRLFHAAWEHSVLPLVAESVWSGPERLPHFEHYAKQLTIAQAEKTADFILLYDYLLSRGLSPQVMKGIILRNLYPKPELRPSADEDLLIRPEEFPQYHRAMLDYGLELVNSDEDIEKAHEVAYQNKEKHLYIEVHKTPFPPESGAYGDLNALFDGALDRRMTVTIYGQQFETLAPTDHLLYLICHAYKHFLHSGVGIRQVADMALFANTYGEDIDWEHIYQACRSVGIDTFTAALFRIAHKYLKMNTIPDAFAHIEVDEQPLLEDILSGGLYGTSSLSRTHSSTITLGAVESSKGHKRSRLRTLFPPLSSLTRRFPYLRKYTFLIPVAWIQRIFIYLLELKHSKATDNNAIESIRLGNERVRLLEKYGIIPKQ